MKIAADAPNPGSDAAIELGCTCPVLDNAHGRGAYGSPTRFWYDGGCPVHFPKQTPYTEGPEYDQFMQQLRKGAS